MATIIIHAGAPKSGSSSIQSWLENHAKNLRRDKDIAIIVAHFLEPRGTRQNDLDKIHFTLYKRGTVMCDPFMRRYFSGEGNKESIIKSFIDGLNHYANMHRTVIVSCEALAHAFCRYDEPFVSALNQLGNTHEVRVAYYVRPQQTNLESSWRQWGFRSGSSPSEYIRKVSSFLNYYEILEWTRKTAPNISFEIRPFRLDLLYGNSVVNDFVYHFISQTESISKEETHIWANKGLPLEIINALQNTPAKLFWSSTHDNRKLDRIKKLANGLNFPETEETRQSRVLLQNYCYETFEPGNTLLIKELGWDTEHLIAPPEEKMTGNLANLDALDQLWSPKASQAELMFFYRALEQAVHSPFDSVYYRLRSVFRTMRARWPVLRTIRPPWPFR